MKKLFWLKALFQYLLQRIFQTKSIGGIIQDETLLAEDEVHFIGEPIALILATSVSIAKEASKLIEIEFEPLEVITNSREAFKKRLAHRAPNCFFLLEMLKIYGVNVI